MLVPVNIKIKFGPAVVNLTNHNERKVLTGKMNGVEIWMQQRGSGSFQPMANVPTTEFAKIVSCDWVEE